MIRIGILGRTRPGRNGEQVARWVLEVARQRTDAALELVDIAAYALPLLDAPLPPLRGQYTQPHMKQWATIEALDMRGRHTGVHSRPLGRAQEPHRLSVSRVEHHSGGTRAIRRCGRRPCGGAGPARHRRAPGRRRPRPGAALAGHGFRALLDVHARPAEGAGRAHDARSGDRLEPCADNGALATPCRSSGGAIVSVRPGSSGDDAALAPACPTVSRAEALSNVWRDQS
jgi:hypothetical protein